MKIKNTMKLDKASGVCIDTRKRALVNSQRFLDKTYAKL